METQNFTSNRSVITIGLLAVASLLLFGNPIQSQDLIWAKQAGGTSIDFSSNIAVDTFGNSYMTGRLEGSAAFGAGEVNDTTLTSIGLADIFVAKYNTDGTFLWAIHVENDTEIDRFPDIALDNSGNCYVTSAFLDTVVFGNGEANETTLASAGGDDIFVAKYSADGMLLWAKQAGGSSNDEGIGIAIDGSGNSCVTGFFIGSGIFGPGEANEIILNDSGNGDIFVAKYDVDGMLLWAKGVGGSEFDSGRSTAVDASGHSFVTGNFQGNATFGGGETNETTLTAGFADMFVAKYSTDGQLIWVKQSIGNDIEAGNRIALDSSGNSHVTGYFESSATFGPGETNQVTLSSSGPQDIFVIKYDVNGMLLWAKQAGSSALDSGSGIVVDAFGNSQVTGYFEGSAVFGPGEANQTILNSAGARDIFVAAFDVDGMLFWAKRAGSSVFDLSGGIAVDPSGNSYVNGRFRESATFGGGEANEITLNSVGETDIFIAKYESKAPTSVAGASIPADFRLTQNYPNPFNPTTTITFEVQEALQITLVIYNLRGQLGRKLFSGKALPGQHHVIWDGTDNNGRNVASGIYIYELRAGELKTTKKMILLQ